MVARPQSFRSGTQQGRFGFFQSFLFEIFHESNLVYGRK
jgi:hypothetical protein